jgi:hypothetical protein
MSLISMIMFWWVSVLGWTSDTVVLPYEVVASCGIYSLFPHTTPHCHIVLLQAYTDIEYI